MIRNGTSRRVTRAIVLVSRSMPIPPASQPATSAPVTLSPGRYPRGAALQASGGRRVEGGGPVWSVADAGLARAVGQGTARAARSRIAHHLLFQTCLANRAKSLFEFEGQKPVALRRALSAA